VNAGGGATSVTITAKDFSFDPDEATVDAGQAVTFTLKNEGSASHTLTFYSDGDFTQPIDGATTERVAGGGSGEFTTTFATAGDVYFRCEVHPTQMKGEVSVQ
jgi:plastocyanin